MKNRLLAFCALVAVCTFCRPCVGAPSDPLLVGWHDEFTRAVVWAPFPGGNADVSHRLRGVVTLTLGASAASDPRTFCWGGVCQDVDVDLSAYPILAVRALRVSPDCWWDGALQSSAGGRPAGHEVKTDSLPEPGLVLFDVSARLHSPAGPNGKSRVRLRLNVAGPRLGGSVDYAWVRFIRREDANRLRRQPDLQNVLLAP